MKTQLRIFWLVSLVFFTAGCSGFQPACFTGEEMGDEIATSLFEDCRLRAGDRVRITTTSGGKMVGDIQRITADWILIAPTSGSEPHQLYTPSQILMIEKSKYPGREPATVEEPQIGDEVALYLMDGSRIEGEIRAVSDTAIVLKHDSGPDERLEFSRDEIVSIENASNGSSGSSSWVAPVAILAGAALVVGGIWFAIEMSEFNDSMGNWGGN
jgi:hypothetical protein